MRKHIQLMIMAIFMTSLLDRSHSQVIKPPLKESYNVTFYLGTAGSMTWDKAFEHCKSLGQNPRFPKLTLAYFADWERQLGVQRYRWEHGVFEQSFWLGGRVGDDCQWKWITESGTMNLEWAPTLMGTPHKCGTCIYLTGAQQKKQKGGGSFGDYELYDKGDMGNWDTAPCSTPRIPLCMTLDFD